jgi:tRNA-splicing ligase RtcB
MPGLEKIAPNIWRIPRHGAMRTEGRIFGTRRLVDAVRDDPALRQVVNVASLPGIVGSSLAMPDIHWGYGFPIGGVAAFDAREGVVSPGGVGYDINCGVRVIATHLRRPEIRGLGERLARALAGSVPAGVGSSTRGPRVQGRDLARVLERGAAWAVEQGWGSAEDLEHTEDQGAIPGADAGAVSDRARERGGRQLGTLGSGNHFVEIGYVDTVLDPRLADALGLALDQVTVSIHTGSRGLGHQVCTDTVAAMGRAGVRYGIELPDRQLGCAPIGSPEGQHYLGAMAAAANFAFANRQIITQQVRDALGRVLGMGPGDLGARLVYDVAHNIAKLEDHVWEGRRRRLLVHRKGATRALPAGHPQVPAAYRAVGQPVLIPGDMGRYSFVAVGGPRAMELSFGSCAHGAGRVLSRKAAVKATRGRSIEDELRHRGIHVVAASSGTVREEAPEAYKDVAEVVDAVAGAGLAIPVVRLAPLVVLKG